ncbi:MAG: leucine-rich repeat domain-containing protein [Clostridia bacterium]|nr:leucine-rich repeat domain-containing protein [Clostridia bacterium]
MNRRAIRLLILMLLIVAITAIAAGTFALAYWSGSPSQEIVDGDVAVVDNSENATTKYLVFEPIGTYSDDYCFEYVDGGGWVLKYEYGDDYAYEGGAHEAGSRNVANSSAISEVNTSCTAVRVVGYIGALGQFENVVIPSTISWNSKTLNVTIIDIKMSEYLTSMNLITGVVIPASITAINGSSFSNANNLTKVYFNNTTLPTIATYCFRGISPTFYKKSGDNYITTTIR